MPMRLHPSETLNSSKVPPRQQQQKNTAPHVMSENRRKVLEEIKKTNLHLLKQGVVNSLGHSFSAPPIPATVAPNNHFAAAPALSSFDISPAQRSAMQMLSQANTTSFGSFVATDSHFGNGILPVLPRLDTKVEKDNRPPPPSSTKTEIS